MKLTTIFKSASLFAALLTTQFASAQSMQEAIQRTIDENPEIQSSKSQRSAIEQQVGQARAGYFPTVDIAAGIGWEQSSSPTTRDRGDGTVSYGREEASIQLRQMIFDGLETYSEVKRQKARTNSSAYSVFGQSEITVLNAVQAYLDVLRSQELVNLAKDNQLIHQKTNNQIALRTERGIGRRADAEQSKGRLALAERNALSETGNLRDAETAFLRIVGILPSDLQAATTPNQLLPESIGQAVEQAVFNHPILKSANADIDSAFAQHDSARAAYLPRIDFEAGASHNVDSDGVKGKNEDAFAMLRLKYNIFNGGKDIARRSETAYLINQAKDTRDNTYRQVVESMRLSWVAHQTIKEQLEFFEMHMISSIKTNSAYQKQFEIGQRTLLDLLDSANEMFSAKSAYTNAKYDEQFSQFRILASKGELNKYLDVSLPEEAIPLD